MKIKFKIPDFKKIFNINIDIQKLKLYFNIILFSIGLILLLAILYFTISDYIKEKNSITYDATITSLNYQNNNYIAQVKYIVEGQTYEQTVKIKNTNITVNDTYTIKYNKNNPNNLIYNNHAMFIIISLPISIIFIKIGGTYLLEKRNKQNKIIKLKTNGILIHATIDEIFINNKTYKYKGKYPYKIRLKYLNPQDNQIYSYETENSYEDIPNIVKQNNIEQLPVYIDRTNTSNYYIDLSTILPNQEQNK